MRREDGFSLIELMVAGLLSIVVLGAVLSMFERSAHNAPDDNEATRAVHEVQVGLDGMVRELRQATSLASVTATSATIGIADGRTVTYNCGLADPDDSNFTYCRRTDSSGQSGSVLRRLSMGTDPVFEQNGPSYLRVSVRTPSQGERTRQGERDHFVELDDAVYMRNLDTGA